MEATDSNRANSLVTLALFHGEKVTIETQHFEKYGIKKSPAVLLLVACSTLDHLSPTGRQAVCSFSDIDSE
jgi:hypothetical protein